MTREERQLLIHLAEWVTCPGRVRVELVGPIRALLRILEKEEDERRAQS